MSVHRYFIPTAAALWLAVMAAHVTAWTPSTPTTDVSPPTSPPAMVLARGTDSSPPTAAQQSGYAGQETCVVCHEGFDTSLNRTRHGFAADARTPAAARGCETCHGPAEAHTQDPEKVKPPQTFSHTTSREINATCTTCHNRGEHTLWTGSQHEARNLACSTCHSVHTPKSVRGQLKTATQSGTCQACHRDKVNKLDRSGHMPVREGKLECSSCHNPHGSQNVRLLRAGHTINETCTKCHADKRGPFLWEHAPVRDNCATCHDPHGSSNDRLLVAKLPFLCQRCHVHTRHPATIYDRAVQNTSNRIFSRSCASCHSQIHGTNHPSGNFLTR